MNYDGYIASGVNSELTRDDETSTSSKFSGFPTGQTHRDPQMSPRNRNPPQNGLRLLRRYRFIL